MTRGRLLLGAAIAVAIGIRLVGIGDPPLAYHPARQYHSLIIARAMHEPEDDVAQAARAAEIELEPPVLEATAALGYDLVGGERVWVGRLVALVMWAAGAVALAALGRRLSSPIATVVAVGLYLFLPFTIEAARSFQPDGPTITAILVYLVLLLRHDDRPTWRRLVGAAAVAGFASFIRPLALFFVVPPYVALALRRRSLLSWQSVAIAALVAIPILAWYPSRILGGDDLDTQAESSIIPGLLDDGFFWTGWWDQLGAVPGHPMLVVGVVGLVAATRGRARAVLLALLAGYVAYSLTFTYRIATHNYYHLILVPLLGLGVGAVVAAVVERLPTPVVRRAAAAASVPVVLVVATSAGEITRVDASAGTRYGAIGDAVAHSTRTVFLAPTYGLPLTYHGRVAGEAWPLAADEELDAYRGIPRHSPEARFAEMTRRADWFIVADPLEFGRQPELARILDRYPLAARGDFYRIHDLR